MNRSIAFGAIAALLLITGFFVVRPHLAGSSVTELVQAAGFESVRVDETKSLPDGMAFTGVHLDAKNLNNIQAMTLRKGKDGKILIIDKLALTGNWESTALPQIAGMTLPVKIPQLVAAMRAQNIKMISLSGAQIDMVLPVAGIVKVQAKGQMIMQDDGSARLQATLWSDQKQLKTQVNVKGEFAPGGIASVDFEIVDGKIDLGAVVANRLGGWVIFNKAEGTTPWTVSGQVAAGSARLYTLLLRGATFSVQGTTQDAALTVQAAGMEDGTSVAIDSRLSLYNKSVLTLKAATNDMRTLINGMMLSSGDGGRANAAGTLTQGGIFTYYAESDKIPTLLDNAKITIANAVGTIWMNGGLRRTEDGVDLDIQEAAMKNFADILGVKNLDTDGLLTGLLNLHGNGRGGVIIEQGLIRSATAGVLSYNAKKLPPQIETNNKNAVDLLKSFAYDRLEISMTSAEEGIDADIKLNGHPLLMVTPQPTQMSFHFQGLI